MSLQSIKKKLKALNVQIEKELVRRDNKFSNASEKWQESDTGQTYLELTSAMSDGFDLTREAEDYIVTEEEYKQ